MSEETLQKMIKQAYEQDDPPLFAWQGGEPIMMGLPFFRRARGTPASLRRRQSGTEYNPDKWGFTG